MSDLELQPVDIAVIGGGPAGMFAAFYCGMRQASVTIIESMPQLGGQLAALYPEKHIYDVAGFPSITAGELVNQLHKQMAHFAPNIRLEEKVVQVIKRDERLFEIQTDKTVHYARAVIITAGVGAFEPRRLELPEAAQYEKRNLHYFINDLQQFKDKHVVISGGGDSAVDWALMLEPIASSVTLVHRRDKFRAHEHSVENLYRSQVQISTPYEIAALQGSGSIDRVVLEHVKTKERTELAADAVIVNFGFISSLGPISDWGIEIEGGSIVVDSRMETSIPGIFAAGDITTYPGKLKLIAVGFGEAPTAVNNAKVYLDPSAKLSPGHSSNMKL
ncbi:FAD-dependent pyridine nucleotide-disulfide oxidoreductase [Paenibacillus curdlanolyticus YK9]|uniref:Ferredoxin--NADP reductase n=1 Tax=Paenibacillus curdlanolyticus YK9 TaxID=717606 RepID=E0IFS7_9BACL|nr:NAD(P)/FAD-dependent oxidoreductase [Paenibacillus curdlanolyticus]EFM08743.1 FAD-dependent pyridine nucleotide-disulfide oxidoreductase [Paenibacillus curdlanolyticus YK9]